MAYDGAAYAGWQRQINAVAVQQVLEEALEDLTNASTAITGASRTDAGVHALGQVAHFDTLSRIPAEKFSFALNTRLPRDIRVVDSRAVAPDFHARFGAVGKRYRYQFHNHRHAPALERGLRWHVPLPLDLDRMRREAE
ncbi:MAG TPA: tRNA pseudouridine(38-40) synthase TruA, partial [Clostridia bacterium]|nr:tRNA pseudouridine(38-40) synthase TruA [Clostridia bacterium]